MSATKTRREKHANLPPALPFDELRNLSTITLEQAAAQLCVSRASIYRAAREGDIPTIVLGPKMVRVPVASFLRLLGAE